MNNQQPRKYQPRTIAFGTSESGGVCSWSVAMPVSGLDWVKECKASTRSRHVMVQEHEKR